MSGNTGLSGIETLLISSTSTVIGKSALYPLDRIKLIAQTEGEIVRNGRLLKPYKGYTDIVKRVYKSEGIRMFWRGNLINITGAISTQAFSFAIKNAFKDIIAKPNQADSLNRKLIKNLTSGGLAGITTTAFGYNFEYVKQRLVSDIKMAENIKGERQFKGIVDVYRKTLQTDGIVGLHRGFVIACLGLFIYRGLYFGLYDTFRPLLVQNAGPAGNLILSFVCGYVTTIVAGTIVYPIDTVRRRMMMRSCETVKYSGSIDCFKYIIRQEGFRALFKGYWLSIISGIVGAGFMVSFDIMRAPKAKTPQR